MDLEKNNPEKTLLMQKQIDQSAGYSFAPIISEESKKLAIKKRSSLMRLEARTAKQQQDALIKELQTWG